MNACLCMYKANLVLVREIAISYPLEDTILGIGTSSLGFAHICESSGCSQEEEDPRTSLFL